MQVTLTNPNNAVILLNAQQQVIITEGNVAPKVILRATQNNQPVTTVTRVDGPVTISVTIEDPNLLDEHTINWSGTDSSLIDINIEERTLTFDPASLPIGLHSTTAIVNDSGVPAASVTQTISLNVIESAPSLSDAQDSDGDGVTDLEEGFQDSDYDGIPDYLDAVSENNLLPHELLANQNSFFMLEAQAGVHLSIGEVSLNQGEQGALVDESDISDLYSGYQSDDNYFHFGGTFDFEMSNLAQVGDSVAVVIALREAIPENAVYRKYHPDNVWQDFVVNANNQIASAAGSQGACPQPGNSAYSSGLTQGHWCVMLTIQDGGANDSDGLANGRILDPGTIGQEIPAQATLTIPGIANVTEGENISLTATVNDNGNDIVSYQWQRVSGPAININGANQLNATILNAPAGTIVVSLSLTDNIGRITTQQISIVVAEKTTTTDNNDTSSSSGGGGGPLSPLLILGLLLLIALHRKKH